MISNSFWMEYHELHLDLRCILLWLAYLLGPFRIDSHSILISRWFTVIIVVYALLKASNNCTVVRSYGFLKVIFSWVCLMDIRRHNSWNWDLVLGTIYRVLSSIHSGLSPGTWSCFDADKGTDTFLFAWLSRNWVLITFEQGIFTTWKFRCDGSWRWVSISSF